MIFKNLTRDMVAVVDSFLTLIEISMLKLNEKVL